MMLRTFERSSPSLRGLVAIALVVSFLTGAPIALAQTTAGQGLAPQAIVQGPGSVAELARALKNDPDDIFEYVYKNIEYSPVFGLSKGPVATILDGRGSDFDQAALMVALLRQAGFTASYQYGQIRLDLPHLANWLGVADLCSATTLLANGGIPISTTASTCGTATTIDVSHVWVQATINGASYVFDPSFKTYTYTSPINLASAMGYSQAGLIGAAETGATITASSIQGVNRTNLRSQLTTYANNLVGYIKQNTPAADVDSVLGGKKITPPSGPLPVRQVSLSYQTPGAPVTVWTGDIDTNYKTQLELQIAGIDLTYTTDALYGHRTTFVYNASNQVVLALDGAVQGTGTAGTAGGSQTLTMIVTHPWVNNNTDTRTLNLTVGSGNIYALIESFGFTGRGLLEAHRKALAQNRQSGGAETSEPVLGESLTVVGLAGTAELSRVAQVSDLIAGTTTDFLHVVGVAGQLVGSLGPFLDLPAIFFSASSNSSNATTPIAASFAGSGDFSVAEGVALDQYLPSNVASVSTIKLLDFAVSQNIPIFDANPTNYASSIRAQLTGYGTTDQANVDALIAQGDRVILPKSGSLVQNQWTGAGLLAMASSGSETQLIYYISSILNGGFSDTPVFLKGGFANGPVDPATFNPLAQNNLLMGVRPDQDPVANAVDLFTGSFLYSREDLAVGSASAFPYKLAFDRLYASQGRLQQNVLGYGWTHSLATSATVNSDGFQALGEDSPIDAAAAIVALYSVLDLMNATTQPLDRMVIAALIQRWLGDQMTNNIVQFVQGQSILQFVKLADGSYNPPPDIMGTLTLASGLYTYVAKDGTKSSFNSAGNIATWQSPAGVTVTYTYDSVNRLITVANGMGRSLSFAYDSAGHLSAATDGTGRLATYTYDSSGNLVSCTDAGGNVTTYAYDSPGRLTQVTLPSFPSTPAVTNTYDTLDRVATQADANNSSSNNTTYNFFLAGYRSEVDDPLGKIRTFFNTSRGKIVRDIDRLGNVANSTYDARDRLTSYVYPEGNAAALAYEDSLNVATGKPFNPSFNPFTTNIAQLTLSPKQGSPLANITQSFTYSANFNKVTTATDALGRATTYSYDATTGNLLSVTRPAVNGVSPVTSLAYNSRGQVTSVTNPLGAVSQYTYDSATENLLSVTTDPGAAPHLNVKSSLAYDAVGNVTSETDPNGNTATFGYNTARLQTSISPPAPFTSPVVFSAYDADGRQLWTQSGVNAANGPWSVSSSTYTPTGKLATKTDPDGNILGYPSATYAYDQLDRLQKITDAEGRVTTFGHDARGSLTQIANTAIQSSPLEQHTYTANGKEASFTDARGNTTTFVYDGFDRLATRTYPDGSTETVTYDAVGNVLSTKTRAGQTIAFTYDVLNRLTTKTPPAPAPVVTYSYDLASHMTGTADNGAAIASAAPPAGTTLVKFTTTYAYDQLNRLTQVTADNVTAAVAPPFSTAVFNHWYNKVNQRIYQTATDNGFWFYPPGATAVSYAANNLNQYTAVGAAAPHYDGNGNLISDGTFTYSYDGENRLVTASGAGNTASYAYDATGRRKSKLANGAATIYIRSGDREVLEYDGASGQILRRTIFDPVRGQPLKVVAPSGVQTTLIPDIEGSIVASVDGPTGTVTKNMGYLPFGESANFSGSFRYTGERIDAETNGLHYLRARMYSPALGRFLQPDPMGYVAGSNLYSYADNDPLDLSDPSGNCPTCIIGAAIGFTFDLTAQYAAAKIQGRSFGVSDVDWVRLGAATLVGGATAGLSAFATAGIEVTGLGVAGTVAAVATRGTINAAIGAAGSMAQTGFLNYVEGRNDDIVSAGLWGAAFGFGGSALTDVGLASLYGVRVANFGSLGAGTQNLLNGLADLNNVDLFSPATFNPLATGAATVTGAAFAGTPEFQTILQFQFNVLSPEELQNLGFVVPDITSIEPP